MTTVLLLEKVLCTLIINGGEHKFVTFIRGFIVYGPVSAMWFNQMSGTRFMENYTQDLKNTLMPRGVTKNLSPSALNK